MSLRFQRSVRLFPGVRLNFSGSGVSTSIGVRGASVTLGPRGAYANVGLPGTGISYRTRLDRPQGRATAYEEAARAPSSARSPISTPGVASIAGTEVTISSADVSTLTSPGLGELKDLINEVTARRADLRKDKGRYKAAIDAAARRLGRAEMPVVRLFTKSSIAALVDAANAASLKLSDTEAHLEGCYVEVDFAVDDGARASYDLLTKAFGQVSLCERIWDVTTIADVNRVATRSAASTALTRTPVNFGFEESDLIRSQFRGMRLGSAEGRDIHIYPGFIMMLDKANEFALIEHSEFICRLAPSNYIEEDDIPSDAEQIGSVWKKSNKDGSADRRFNGNYQIPLLKYGGLSLSSPTGLREAYNISSYSKTYAFVEALGSHKQALARSTSATNLPALPAPTDGIVEEAVGCGPIVREFTAQPRKYVAVDAMVLTFGIGAVVSGALWTSQHWRSLGPKAPVPPPVAQTVVDAPKPTRTPVRHHRRRHHPHAKIVHSAEA